MSNGEAYLVKLLAEWKVKTPDQLADLEDSFVGSDNYRKIIRFGDEKLKSRIIGYIVAIDKRKDQKRLQELLYKQVQSELERADTIEKVQLIKRQYLNKQYDQDEVAQHIEKICDKKQEDLRLAEQEITVIQNEYDQAFAVWQKAMASINALKAELEDIEHEKRTTNYMLSQYKKELNVKGYLFGKRKKQLENEDIPACHNKLRKLEQRESGLNQKIKQLSAELTEKPSDKERLYTIASIYKRHSLFEQAYINYKKIEGYKDVASLLKNDEYLLRTKAALNWEKNTPEEQFLDRISEEESMMTIWRLWSQAGLGERYKELNLYIEEWKECERLYGRIHDVKKVKENIKKKLM